MARFVSSKIGASSNWLGATSLWRDAEPVAFYLKIEHESFNAGGYGAEIMVFELLVLGAFMSHKCAAGHHQVGTGAVESFVDEEVFLFPTEIRIDMFYLRIEILCYRCSRFVYGVERFKKRSLVVERFACI